VQVLQTDVGKPMTLSFNAVSTKTIGWPTRLAGGAVAFAMLWLIVAIILRGRRRE